MVAATLVLHSAFALADLSFDGANRFIMAGKRMKFNIINEGNTDALADVSVTWGDERNVEPLPLAVSRPLLRISPNNREAVDIIYQGAGFPSDRESYLLLNVLDVPTAPRDPNVLQIALRHRLKLFYRPALKGTLDDAMGTLSWEIGGKGRASVLANNPSPYYLTLSDIEVIDRNHRNCGESIDHLMISPFSTSPLEVPNCTPAALNFSVISDGGSARPYRVELISGRSNVGLRRQ
ncbi:fimbrial biogenesis chaperone [Burkholderia metallica]|uniref:fimbrial biogenesis chaperone n=1 Tax=Burkholderia metallica TaxID=488729 RepID=UPI001CF26344|nr:molecular chaperone [Burkholderia metallica]MCA7996623.1 molecular chaperone [Burkholderia metallica]